MTCYCCYLRAAADLASATYAQTEKKVEADLANMKKYLTDAQDHANRQAFNVHGQAVILSHNMSSISKAENTCLPFSLVGAGGPGCQIFGRAV